VELGQVVATLRDKNADLKTKLSTAEQEIKIHNTVEREHQVSPHLVLGAHCLIGIPD